MDLKQMEIKNDTIATLNIAGLTNENGTKDSIILPVGALNKDDFSTIGGTGAILEVLTIEEIISDNGEVENLKNFAIGTSQVITIETAGTSSSYFEVSKFDANVTTNSSTESHLDTENPIKQNATLYAEANVGATKTVDCIQHSPAITIKDCVLEVLTENDFHNTVMCVVPNEFQGQQTMVEEQQTIVEEQQTMSEEEQTIIEEQEIIFEEQQTMVEEEQAMAEERQTMFEKQKTMVEEQQTIVEKQQTMIEEQQTIVEEKVYNEYDCSQNIEIEKFLCKECGRVFKDDRSFQIHSGNHLQKKELKTTKKNVVCQKCQKTFSNKWSYKHHLCFSKRFICEYCGARYGRKGDMKRHIVSIHSESKLFKCKSCDKRFATERHLAQHENIHSKWKPFQCQLCGKRYSQKSHLERHKYVHYENSVKCKNCSRRFVDDSKLNLHVCKGVKRQFKFPCNLCKKTFTRKNDLKRHLFLHSGEKPLSCSACGKSFVTSWHLKHHELVHTGEKPYQCHCGTNFTQKSHLNRHKISHALEVFKCKQCKRRFANKERLTKHEMFHFKKKSQHGSENGTDVREGAALECLLAFAKNSTRTTHHYTSMTNTDTDVYCKKVDNRVSEVNQQSLETVLPSNFSNKLKPSVDPDKEPLCSDDSKQIIQTRNVCKYCNRSFLVRAKLLKHYSTHAAFHFDSDISFLSSQEREKIEADCKKNLFTCLRCNRTYSNENRCNDHKLSCVSHKNEQSKAIIESINDESKPSSNGHQTCKVCNKVFKNRMKFKRHEIYHSRRPFSVVVNSGEEPVKMLDLKLLFVCSYCAKEFAYKTSFERHEHQHQLHLGLTNKSKSVLNKHVCKECGKDFQRITHLERHLKLHKDKDEKIKKSVNEEVIQFNAHYKETVSVNSTTNISTISKRSSEVYLIDSATSEKNSPPQHCEKKSKVVKNNANTLTNDLINNLLDLKNQMTKHTSDGGGISVSLTHRPIRKRKVPERYRDALQIYNQNTILENVKGSTESIEKAIPQSKTIRVFTERNKNENFNSNSQEGKVHEKQDICEEINNGKTSEKVGSHTNPDTKPIIIFDCKSCKKEFTSKISLLRHMKHDPAKPLVCKTCCRRFSSQESLHKHESGHIGKYFISCEECGKGFNHRSLLETHMQKHTGNKTYMCDVCGKMFVSKYNLKAHGYTHSGTSPFVCKVCGKYFGRKNDLIRHQLNHEGTQPYPCSMCDRKFISRWHLRYHEKSHNRKHNI